AGDAREVIEDVSLRRAGLGVDDLVEMGESQPVATDRDRLAVVAALSCRHHPIVRRFSRSRQVFTEWLGSARPERVIERGGAQQAKARHCLRRLGKEENRADNRRMRAIWKGAVAFGLVNVPVKVYSATEDHDISLHQVHDKDGGRIRYQRRCEVCGKIVDYD